MSAPFKSSTVPLSSPKAHSPFSAFGAYFRPKIANGSPTASAIAAQISIALCHPRPAISLPLTVPNTAPPRLEQARTTPRTVPAFFLNQLLMRIGPIRYVINRSRRPKQASRHSWYTARSRQIRRPKAKRPCRSRYACQAWRKACGRSAGNLPSCRSCM